MMFKKVQKTKTSSQRVREQNEEGQNEEMPEPVSHDGISMSSMEFIKEQQENKGMNNQEMRDMEDEGEEGEGLMINRASGSVKKRFESKFSKKQVNVSNKSKNRRGQVHQGSYQGGAMMTFGQQQVDQNQQTSSSQFAPKIVDLDQEMIDTSSGLQVASEIIDILPGDFEEEDEEQLCFITEDQKAQIRRLKELKSKKITASTFIPLDDLELTQLQQPISLNNYEAQLLQQKILKDRYGESTTLPLPSIKQSLYIHDDEDMHHDSAEILHGDEEEEEVEAFIKKRVKEGAGRDYESIVKKDIVNYQRVTLTQAEGDYSEIQKYENSTNYKKVQGFMQTDEEQILTELDKEISKLQQSLTNNKDKLKELEEQETSSTTLIEQAEKQFQAKGQLFIKAMQATEILEDLRDMLTEKSIEINELQLKRLELEKEVKSSVDTVLIAHIADIFAESNENQTAYAVTQHFNEALNKDIKDSKLTQERKLFRQVNQQQDESNLLWMSIVDIKRQNELQQKLDFISRENPFEDVGEEYQSLSQTLFKALNEIQGIEQFQMQLNDLSEYVVPYLQNEALSSYSTDQPIKLFDFDQWPLFNEVTQFVNDSDCSEYQKRVFISTVITASYHTSVVSYIKHLWNPFDLQESTSLCTRLRAYIDLLYISPPDDSTNDNSTSFGLKYVKDLMNTVIYRLKSTLDLFHLTSTTCLSLPLVNALDSLTSSILCFKTLLPDSNLTTLLLEEMLLSNFLKALGKRLHKITVEEQTITTLSQAERIKLETERERAQLAFEYVVTENKGLSEFIINSENAETNVTKGGTARDRLKGLLRELKQDKGLGVDEMYLQ